MCPQGWQFERSSHKVGRSKGKVPQGWEKGVFERPRSFLFQVSPPPWVLQAYAVRTTGMPPARRRVSSRVFSSRWSSTLRPFLPQPRPRGCCLHKVRFRPPRGRCSLSWTVTGSKSSGRPVACKGATQHNEGSNPKTGRVRDPINKKDLAKRQVS